MVKRWPQLFDEKVSHYQYENFYKFNNLRTFKSHKCSIFKSTLDNSLRKKYIRNKICCNNVTYFCVLGTKFDIFASAVTFWCILIIICQITYAFVIKTWKLITFWQYWNLDLFLGLAAKVSIANSFPAIIRTRTCKINSCNKVQTHILKYKRRNLIINSCKHTLGSCCLSEEIIWKKYNGAGI